MVDRTPLRLLLDELGNPAGLAEFRPDETIPVSYISGLAGDLSRIDALLQVLVQTVGENTPPAGVEGQRFIVGTVPTGAWSGQANKLARFLDGAWQFFDARYVLNATDGLWYVRSASTWSSVSGVPTDGSITNAKLADVPTQTIKGRTTAGSGDPEDLTASQARSVLSVREQLTTNRTYYVRTDGNDSNNGLSAAAGGAFLTIQHAVNVAAGLDQSIFDITISVGPGTFGSFICADPVGSGAVRITGSGPTNTFILRTETSGSAIQAGSSLRYVLSQFSVSAPNGTARAIVCAQGASIILSTGLDFGPCGVHHIDVSGGAVSIITAYSISGGGGSHWFVANGGRLICAGRTITINGAPDFSTGWAYCDVASLMRVNANTFIGSATGRRYYAAGLSLIFVNAAGETYLPGSTAGVVASGGVYA